MSTFDTVSRLCGAENGIKEFTNEVESYAPPQVELVHPQKWDSDTLRAWLDNLPGKYKEPTGKIPKSFTGKQFMGLSAERLGQMMNLKTDKSLAHQLYNRCFQTLTSSRPRSSYYMDKCWTNVPHTHLPHM